MRPTRRRLLGAGLGAATALALGSGRAEARPAAPPRMAALDWGLAVAALEIGAPPVAVAEQALYGAWVREPALPPGTVELGLRTTPSFEGLAELGPDLILANPLNEPLRPRLEAIAPVLLNGTFGDARAPLAASRAVTTDLARLCGRAEAAAALLAAVDARLAHARDRLGGARPAPRALLPVSLVDTRHLTIYGAGSLHDDVLKAVGLVNAFAGPTSVWGTALRGIDDLAGLPAFDLLVLSPVPAEAEPTLRDEGSLLPRLLRLRGGRLHCLPPAWPFGGVSAAARFAEAVADALVPAT